MWKSCREQDKSVKDILASQRKRAQRKKAFAAQNYVDPLQELRVANCGVEVVLDGTMWRSLEEGSNLMRSPWNPDVTFDKYDVRALLEDIPKWKPQTKRVTEEERKLESSLNFERYRDLVEAESQGRDSASVLKAVKDNILSDKKFAPTLRDLPAKTKADTYVVSKLGMNEFRTKSQTRSGQGQYSAVQFDYESNTGVNASKVERPEEFEEQKKEPAREKIRTTAQLIEEDPSQQRYINRLGSKYGIDDFCRIVRKESKEASKDDQRQEDSQTVKLSRREKRERRLIEQEYQNKLARREQSKGLKYGRSDSRSRSRSPPRYIKEGEIKFITEFRISNCGSSDNSSYSSDSEDYGNPSGSAPLSASGSLTGTTIAIKEATEETDQTSTILRKPGDRWNFARSIDEKFNQPRYNRLLHPVPLREVVLSKTEREKETKKAIEQKLALTSSAAQMPKNKDKETPQERLRRKMREQLQKKMKEDEAKRKVKEAADESERRKKEELFGYNYGLRRSSPDYGYPRHVSESDSESEPAKRKEKKNSGHNKDLEERRRSRSRDRDKERERRDLSRSSDKDRDRRDRSRNDRWSRSRSRDRRRSSRSRSSERRDRDKTREERRSSRSRSRDRRDKTREERRSSRSRSRDRRDRRSRSQDRETRTRSHDQEKDRKRPRSPPGDSLPSKKQRTSTTTKQPRLSKYDRLMQELSMLEEKAL